MNESSLQAVRTGHQQNLQKLSFRQQENTKFFHLKDRIDVH